MLALHTLIIAYMLFNKSLKQTGTSTAKIKHRLHLSTNTSTVTCSRINWLLYITQGPFSKQTVSIHRQRMGVVNVAYCELTTHTLTWVGIIGPTKQTSLAIITDSADYPDRSKYMSLRNVTSVEWLPWTVTLAISKSQVKKIIFSCKTLFLLLNMDNHRIES